MATLISAPAQNSILNDANITEVIVEDTTSFDHYRATIYIDGVFFDNVVMPKISATRMMLVFENLLLKYISLSEVDDFLSVQSFRLIRDFKIEITRKINPTSPYLIMFTLNYKLKYSQYPTKEVYENSSLKFIAVDPEVLLVQPKTKIQLPVFVNGSAILLYCQAVTEEGTILNSYIFNGTQNKNTVLLSLEVNAPENVNAYFFRVKYESYVIEKKIKVVRNSIYSPKKIRFYNRFGMPILIELFGKLITKDEQTYYQYQSSMGIYTVEEIQSDTQVSIDTGYLLNNEREIISQIASSNKIQIEIEGKFIPCIVTIKNVPQINENEFVNSLQLTFEFNKNPKIKN